MDKNQLATKECGYRRNSECSPEITHFIKRYFVNGTHLYLCEKHAKEWISLHPYDNRGPERIR